MSTLTLMRIYMKYHNLPRLPLPCIGYAGTMYSSPLLDRQASILRDASGHLSPTPELAGTSSIILKKGSIGSLFFRRYSTSVADIKKAEKARTEKGKKVWSAETVKILLVDEKGALTTVTLADADKLAKKKGLVLIHVTDPKEKPIRSDKEVYKLVSRLADLEEDEDDQEIDVVAGGKQAGRVGKVSSTSKMKEPKIVLMKSNIGDHDVAAKINSMKKWIQKGNRVRVAITQVGDKESAEVIFTKIEEEMKSVEGQIQQKISKGNELRFYVGPPKASRGEKLKSSEPTS